MMPRYIDAEFVENEIASLITKYERLMPKWSPNDMLTSGRDTAMKLGYKADGAEKALEIVNKTPTADVQEVKHGRWEDHYVGDSLEGFVCTVCKEPCECAFDYCPGCGAKMDGGE